MALISIKPKTIRAETFIESLLFTKQHSTSNAVDMCLNEYHPWCIIITMKISAQTNKSNRWKDIRRTLSSEREAKIRVKVDEELAKLGLAPKKIPDDRP